MGTKKPRFLCLAVVAVAAVLLTGNDGRNLASTCSVDPFDLFCFFVDFVLLTRLLDLSPASAKKSGDVTQLQIGVKYKPESCTLQAHKGDKIKVHYRGSLTDGSVFDSSYDRGDPFEFTLGNGQVIKGWDQGLLGMCVGEKRKLRIPAKMGYGERGSPPKIPGGATLVFDTELIAVNGKTSAGATTAEGDDSEL
ncbi:peptidyl-prolyl cis-trans isomerase FKBP17 [Hordeum vulgare]|nr:peptidyl-prolyl cis-trans isomerase FKBP17 [Hordeum vulgare]